ncbi:hypothetical protein PtA15_9A707 [Puccinia triticina]|uniref:Uncharacterized protein n=1 Tax=Puccinia triticina TaxID=208348 RepID=A0ABY7CXR9_9BASI|nr:uncharacterized protein PtA15_9A707 [Puccinia triticina]WAQ88580.1 hypothetical protein PtA15_9A707 [Puccinia triticina]
MCCPPTLDSIVPSYDTCPSGKDQTAPLHAIGQSLSHNVNGLHASLACPPSAPVPSWLPILGGNPHYSLQ